MFSFIELEKDNGIYGIYEVDGQVVKAELSKAIRTAAKVYANSNKEVVEASSKVYKTDLNLGTIEDTIYRLS